MKNNIHHNNTSDDEGLLNKYRQSGDMESLGLLFGRYIHLVYGLCLKYLKSREESQDAVMAIFETIAQKLEKQEINYFKSWLYIVSKNHCLMVLRRKTVEPTFNGLVMESETVWHPNEEPGIEDDLQALEDCIEKLKDDQQKCVKMFYLNHKSYEEIAQTTLFSTNKVKSYIQNGKRNLKICLETKHVSR